MNHSPLCPHCLAVVLPLALFLLGCAHTKAVKPNTKAPKYDPRVVPESNTAIDGPRAGGKAWLEDRRKEKGW